ncbi:polypeptide N-acetylgalactosaminyltransferase 5-like [Liolophura sinensis]|uniref:polypeptide N-acetylgalactosaminyltransferase 5-like n=1 Tax=Liolophura sinensis TaxID=3198878 RepID=UPI0031595EAA
MAYRPMFVAKWLARALLLTALGYVTCGLFYHMDSTPAVHVRQQDHTTQPKVGQPLLKAQPAAPPAVDEWRPAESDVNNMNDDLKQVTEDKRLVKEHGEQIEEGNEGFRESMNREQEAEIREQKAPNLNSQSQEVASMDLPKAEADKALAEICRKMNLTLDNPENGIGEFSRPAGLNRDNLTASEKKEWDSGYETSGYNVYVSNRIALRRRVEDTREQMCHNITYPTNLPQASVIIPYHKEALSTLLRTVFSTIERAPAHLLKEVILVDDFSESEELLGPLDEFVAYLPKVQVLRNTKREGLMRTRMRGVMAATAPVIVIKDAHTEYLPGWLEPLLAVVAANRTAIAQSNVNFMDINQFKIYVNVPTNIHTFDFKLNQQISPLPDKEVKKRKSPIDPVL